MSNGFNTPIRLGALSTGSADDLRARLDVAFAQTEPVRALLNAASAQGASSGLIAGLNAQHDVLRGQIGEAINNIDTFEDSAAQSLVASLEQQAQGLRQQAAELAGERPLTGPVLWGAAAVILAGGTAYLVWRASKKKRRNRRRR